MLVRSSKWHAQVPFLKLYSQTEIEQPTYRGIEGKVAHELFRGVFRMQPSHGIAPLVVFEIAEEGTERFASSDIEAVLCAQLVDVRAPDVVIVDKFAALPVHGREHAQVSWRQLLEDKEEHTLRELCERAFCCCCWDKILC